MTLRCSQGHDITSDDAVYIYRRPDGVRRQCKECRKRTSREYSRRRWASGWRPAKHAAGATARDAAAVDAAVERESAMPWERKAQGRAQ